MKKKEIREIDELLLFEKSRNTFIKSQEEMLKQIKKKLITTIN